MAEGVQLRDGVECVWWGLFIGTRCLCFLAVASQILRRALQWFLFTHSAKRAIAYF